MDNQTLLYVATIFAVIGAISLVVQACFAFGVYRAAKSTEQRLATLLPKLEAAVPKVEALVPRVEGLLDSSHSLVDHGRQQFLDVTTKTNDILDITLRQLVKIEEVVNDASSRAKVQLEHAELVLNDTVSRAHDTVAMVHNGISRPLREIQGLSVGIRAALNHLARGTRPTPGSATQDDEMFI
jgi:hypothetical protein